MKNMAALETPNVQVERLNPELDYIEAIRIASEGNTNRTPLPQGYELDKSFGKEGFLNTKSGAQVVALKDIETGKKIIAIAGTNEGKDIKDWPTAGKEQWDEIKEPVNKYVKQQPNGSSIEITGHSLGGGVAQHGIYDLKDPKNQNTDKNITGTTFDAPGASSSIEEYDEKRITQKDIKNYVVKGSPVSVSGGKHVGGNTRGVEPDVEVDNSKLDPVSVYREGKKAIHNHQLDGIENSMQKTITHGEDFQEYDPNPVDYPATYKNLFNKKEPNNTTDKKDEKISLLNGVGEGLGAAGDVASDALSTAGSAAMDAGKMAFDTAMNFSQQTAGNAVHAAIRSGGQGGGKAALKQAAQATLGQMLGQFQIKGQQMQDSELARTPGIAGPLEPVHVPQTSQRAIEGTMADSSNNAALERAAGKVMQRMQNDPNGSQNPMDLLVQEVLGELKGGNIRIQPHILVPELPNPTRSQKDDSLEAVFAPQKREEKDSRIMVAGVEIPVRMPKIKSEEDAHVSSFREGEFGGSMPKNRTSAAQFPQGKVQHAPQQWDIFKEKKPEKKSKYEESIASGSDWLKRSEHSSFEIAPATTVAPMPQPAPSRTTLRARAKALGELDKRNDDMLTQIRTRRFKTRLF